MVAGKGKKLRVMNRDGVHESELINEELVMSIEKLQEIQDELEKVNEEASDKVLEVEQKYNEIRRPVYNKRQEIIQTIPDFWLTAFLSHPALGDLLSEEDQKIFKYLHSLDVEDFKDVKSGFYITFTFSPNPYFENEKLTKTFSFKDEGPTDVICTPIKWKEAMDINNGVKDAKKGSKRLFSEESFFSWFSENQQKELPEGFQDEIAELIKDDLWPNPLKYFNNEVEEGDFDGDDGEDEDKSGDDTEEEGEEEEEEEGEDDDDN